MKNLILGSVLALSSSFVFAGELQDRAQVHQQVSDWFNQGNYSDLEKMYLHFRDDHVRTSGGTFALDEEFYSGLLNNLYGKTGIISPDDVIWRQDEISLKKWMAQFPKSPAPRIAYAELLHSHGWAYRGESTIDTVEEKNWAPFHQYIRSSRQYLNSIKSLSKKDPHWYVESLSIAIVENLSEAEYKTILDEAAAKYSYYYNIYYTAVQHYLPIWGGSFKELDDLANYAAQKTQSSDGDDMYARIYWSVEGKGANGQFKFRQDTFVDWERMKKGLDDIIIKYPSDWNITHYAYLACRANDQIKTAELFKKIPDYARENWPRPVTKENYYFCKFFSENRNDQYITFLDKNGNAVTPIAIKKYREYMDALDSLRKANQDEITEMSLNSLPVEERNKKAKEQSEYLQNQRNIFDKKYHEFVEAMIAGD